MEDTGLLRRYADIDGWLHRNVPLVVTENTVWRNQFFYYDSWLWVGDSLDMATAKREFVRQAYSF